MNSYRPAYWWPLALLAVVLLAVYRFWDPGEYAFPACPVHRFTGLLCPGCGSQRALHRLLNGELSAAFRYNPLLVLSIPYLAAGFLFEIPVLRQRWPVVRRIFFGYRAAWVAFVAVVAFTLLRNLSCWP